MPEPNIMQGQNPEAALHGAVVTEVHYVLSKAGAKFIIIEKFGFDIGIFIQHDGKEYARFIEIKAFVGSRAGGVGFGNSRGEGSQVDILIQPVDELTLLNASVLWLLGMDNLLKASPRYAVFSSVDAKKSSDGYGTARKTKQSANFIFPKSTYNLGSGIRYTSRIPVIRKELFPV